jgi:hypothetical protein
LTDAVPDDRRALPAGLVIAQQHHPRAAIHRPQARDDGHLIQDRIDDSLAVSELLSVSATMREVQELAALDRKLVRRCGQILRVR